jgi:hypothetical protein
MDRNNYYGGASASLSLNQVSTHNLGWGVPGACAAARPAHPEHAAGIAGPPVCYPLPCPQLYEKFKPGQTPPQGLGPNRDYNIDLVSRHGRTLAPGAPAQARQQPCTAVPGSYTRQAGVGGSGAAGHRSIPGTAHYAWPCERAALHASWREERRARARLDGFQLTR